MYGHVVIQRPERERGTSAALGLEVWRSSSHVLGIPVRDDQLETHGLSAALDRDEVVVPLGAEPDERRDTVDRPVHEFRPIAVHERQKLRLQSLQVCRGHDRPFSHLQLPVTPRPTLSAELPSLGGHSYDTAGTRRRLRRAHPPRRATGSLASPSTTASPFARRHCRTSLTREQSQRSCPTSRGCCLVAHVTTRSSRSGSHGHESPPRDSVPGAADLRTGTHDAWLLARH